MIGGKMIGHRPIENITASSLELNVGSYALGCESKQTKAKEATAVESREKE